ncbi:MAG TPA: response regulator transcription factor [Thermoanaerobaculia bacterium]|nr:response regulator transcription factor [Thermoanaerobaculia bacterium]
MIGDERTTLRVGIVEDDARTRDGLAYLIDATPELTCVGRWGSVEALLARGASEPPDVLLLDIELPGRPGSEAVAEIRRRHPATTVLMLTVFDDEERIFESLRNGAHGYLLKRTAPDKLLAAIREAASGGSPMSPEIARRVVTLFGRSAPQPVPAVALSPQELRLLALLAGGHGYQSAADALSISVNTVRNYVRSVYEKLHVHSQSAAVAKAIRAGLI